MGESNYDLHLGGMQRSLICIKVIRWFYRLFSVSYRCFRILSGYCAQGTAAVRLHGHHPTGYRKSP